MLVHASSPPDDSGSIDTTMSAAEAVLTSAELIWVVFDHLDDTDLRTLAMMPEFSSLVRSPPFARSRRARHRARLSLLLSGTADAAAPLGLARARRASLPSLVSRNLVRGGAVTVRLASEGFPVLGPEHAARCELATKLSDFLLRKRLTARLAARSEPSLLADRNILVGGWPLALDAPALVPRRVALEAARTRDTLARRLAARPPVAELYAAGVVPVHAVAAPCAGYLSLLPQQVVLANLLVARQLAVRVARRPVVVEDGALDPSWLTPPLVSIDLERVAEEMDAWLRARVSPLDLASKKLLVDRDLALMVCPSVRDKVRYFETLAATA
ncbi:hypothetical protein H9P43_000172 [Blastocladiella emersonii ATCC 22665]|nr:hypothetical protein H9P43_000172 [Blastocladiella emersonii ATCC 22665]